ncbi:MAG: LCP family protein, partial [Dehalococcoidia bacterium]
MTEATLRAGSYPRRPRPRRKARDRGQRILFVVAAVTLALCSAYSSMAMLSKVWPALFPGQTFGIPGLTDVVPLPESSDDSAFNRRINLLVIGLDKRVGFQMLDAYNTDVIMVATIDPVTRQASLLSFPRDLYIDVQLPDRQTPYKDRINTSYAQGILDERSFESGANQLARDIELNFGIAIDHWIVMDFEGVESLVNALEGVDVDIPYDLSVPYSLYSNDDVTARYIRFPEGPYHFDGYEAVAFGRYRNTDDDLHRVKRQQLIMVAAINKVFERGLINNPLELWDAYNDAFKTDIPRTKMAGYALLLKQTNGTMRTFSLCDPVNESPTVTGWTTPGGGSVLLWEPQNVQYILGQVFTKSVYANSNVEIANAYDAGQSGEARANALGRYLKFKGLPSVYIGEDLALQPTTRIVLYDPDRMEMAEDIANWMAVDPSIIVSE